MSTRNHASSRSRARRESTKWRVSAEWAETCKHERSGTRPVDAGAHRRRHHDGFCHGLTLMGLGMFFGFIAFYDPSQPWAQNPVFDLMVQRTYGAMTHDVLISIPLVV